MKKLALVPLGLLACSFLFAGPNPNTPPSAKPTSGELAKAYGKLPLSFEPNEGQADASVKFMARGAGYSLFLTKTEAFIALEQQAAQTKPDNQDEDPFLKKLDAKTRKRFEASKIYRLSPRFRKSRTSRIVGIAIDGASVNAKLEPLDETEGKSNYFIGNDPSRWRTVPNYARVRYSGIYPGVDLIYYGNQGQFEFDFIVSPGADPNKIALKVLGQEHPTLMRDGALRLGSGRDAILLRRPSIYQTEHGKKRTVEGGFVLLADGRIGVHPGVYDRNLPLIVDPVLAYSTFLTGSVGADTTAIAVDSGGYAYVVGLTGSTDFPIVNGYQSAVNNGSAFVAKLNPNGTQLLYSTFLNGTGESGGTGIAIDGSGNAYVTGYTFSTDFPVVNGFQTTNNNAANGNAFVARIDTTQTGTASLVYSTYLGGGGNTTAATVGDLGLGIATDGGGLAYVTGLTTSDTSVAPFPTTANAYQSSLNGPNGNAFFTIINTAQSGAASLAYSTYLGGNAQGPLGDSGMGIAVNASGSAYIVGQTSSSGSVPFPNTANAYQSSLNSPNGNAFISEFSGSSLVYSTLFGGSTTNPLGDFGSAVALDSAGAVYVAGDAMSSDFPTTAGAFQTSNNANGRAFVAKFDLTQSGTQSLIYSTLLGGSGGGGGGDGASGVAPDVNGNAFVSGWTYSSDFPVTSGAFQSATKTTQYTGTLSQINPQGSALLYATYLGGSCAEEPMSIALDPFANSYLAGYTCSADFPISATAFQTSLVAGQDGFVTKFALSANPGIMLTISPPQNSSGWNNSPVTVSFNCIPGGAPIVTCPSPVSVTTQGANQAVSGTVTDSAGNSSTANTSISLDTTPPSISISSPSNGAFVSTPYVNVTGAVSDALSGVGGVICNYVPATVSGTSFFCAVRLSTPLNTINVTAADLAGNLASTSVSVGISMPAPMSIQVTPGPMSIGVGQIQSFSAIDETGRPRPDSTWSVSDTTIATLASDGSGTLTGVAVGQVTLSATVQGVSGQTTVTVTSGIISPGTVLWTAPAVSGFTTQQIVQAVATANGPDLFSLDTDSSGDVLVRAFKSDGEQLWQNSMTQSNYPGLTISKMVGDNQGGVFLLGTGTNSDSQITDLNVIAGAQTWQASSSQTSSFDTNIAVGLDGTVYVHEVNCVQYVADCLDGFDGTTGSLKSQVQLPQSTSTVDYTACNSPIDTTTYSPGLYSDPIVGPDGAVYMQSSTSLTYEARTPAQFCLGIDVVHQTNTLAVLKNGAAYATITTSTNNSGFATSFSPFSTVPDGNGGVLVSFEETSSGYPQTTTPMLADTNGASSVANTNGPISMVLGDNNTAFITDGQVVESFNAATLAQNWAYTSTSGGNLSFVRATAGASVTINDNLQGTIQFDSFGNPSTPIAGLQGYSYFGNSAWVGITGAPALAEVAGNFLLPTGLFDVAGGDPAMQSRPTNPDIELVWCSGGGCNNLAPSHSDRDVAFIYYQDNPTHMPSQINLTASQVALIQQTANNAFQLAFAPYKVNVGTGRQGTFTAYVVGQYPDLENGMIPCGTTNPLTGLFTKVQLSRVFYLTNMENAQWALMVQTAQPPNDLITAIGEGVGNIAAHEIGHQFAIKYSNIVGTMGMHDGSTDTYNGGDCSDPASFKGKDNNGVAIHWGSVAVQGLTKLFGTK